MSEELDLDFDNLMSDLGLDTTTKELTSEEALYTLLAESTRFNNTWCLIDFDAYKLKKYKEVGFKLVKTTTVTKNGVAQIMDVPVTLEEYLRMLLHYYLFMYHLTKFNASFTFEGTEYPPCDIERTIDLFMGHDRIQKIIHKKVS